MNPGRPRDQRGTAHRRADEAAMDTFTVRLPRWPILLRLNGRDPLVRTTDQIEALVFVLAVVVSLLAAPITAAVGTAVYDSSRHIYAEQAHTRHTVTATVTDVPASQQILRCRHHHRVGPMDCRGTDTRHRQGASTANTGDPIEIWVDNNGTQVAAPTPTTRAAAEAAMGALVLWICVAAIAATLFTVTRAACDRIRFARMARRPRQPGGQWRRTSASRPHVGPVMLLMAPRNHPPRTRIPGASDPAARPKRAPARNLTHALAEEEMRCRTQRPSRSRKQQPRPKGTDMTHTRPAPATTTDAGIPVESDEHSLTIGPERTDPAARSLPDRADGRIQPRTRPRTTTTRQGQRRLWTLRGHQRRQRVHQGSGIFSPAPPPRR